VRDFTGRVAVVTGGASGIGLAMARRFAAEGMKLVLADLDEAPLAAAVDALKSRSVEVIGVPTDVTRADSVEALAREAVARFGHVHVLCNNAGVGAHEDVALWELPLSDWRWTFAVNVFGVIHGVRAFLPGMLAHGEEGHVVNTSSGNGGLSLVPSTPIYSASKAAVSSLTETLHLQLVQRQAKIRAHVLYPGPHLVASNIFEAASHRQPEYAREVPQVAPKVTLEMLRGMAKQAGFELQTTTPTEVAEHVIAGLRTDAYYILPASPDGDARFRLRVENVLARRNPVPPAF
jgi:NAD(P)-dependent dehydrogenase (short-subunit alcohol dehydrogenase family)